MAIPVSSSARSTEKQSSKFLDNCGLPPRARLHPVNSSASLTKVATRQIAGAFSQLEKARLVAKLKAEPQAKPMASAKAARATPRRCLTPSPWRRTWARGLSYRKIAAELATQGHVTRTG
jgi:hypothetical protein